VRPHPFFTIQGCIGEEQMKWIVGTCLTPEEAIRNRSAFVENTSKLLVFAQHSIKLMSVSSPLPTRAIKAWILEHALDPYVKFHCDLFAAYARDGHVPLYDVYLNHDDMLTQMATLVTGNERTAT